MIRGAPAAGLLPRLPRGALRAVGWAALLAFVVVLVVGATHAAEPAHGDGHGACGACVAYVAAAGAALAPPSLDVAAALPAETPVAPPTAPSPLVSEPGRLPAPRGPPDRT